MVSESKPQDERARLAGDYQECERTVAAAEAELRRIGVSFEALGKQLQTDPSSLSAQRLTVEKDLAVLWLILPDYIEALLKKEATKAALDRLK